MNGLAIDFSDVFTQEQTKVLNQAFQRNRQQTKEDVKDVVVTKDFVRAEIASANLKNIMWMIGIQFASFLGILTLLPRFLS